MDNSNITCSIVFHIGYHKTGTTFLQHKIFSQHNEIIYLGQPFSNQDIDDYFYEFKNCHEIEFNYLVFRRRFFNLLSCYSDEVLSEKILLVSLESLHSGFEWFGRDIVTMSHRLNKTFPSAKIIFGIRKQNSYTLSNYKEYILHGGKMKFNDFLYNSFYFSRCLKPKLCYDKVVSLYEKLFGVNLYVYSFEIFFNSIDKGTEDLLVFIGVKNNINININNEKIYEGMSDTSVTMLRFFNLILAKDFLEQYYDVGRKERLTKKEIFRRNIILKVLRKFDAINPIKLNFIIRDKDNEFIIKLFKKSNNELKSKYPYLMDYTDA